MTQLPEELVTEITNYLNYGYSQQLLLEFIRKKNNRKLTHSKVKSILEGNDLRLYTSIPDIGDRSTEKQLEDAITMCIGNNQFTVYAAERCAKLLNVTRPVEFYLSPELLKQILGKELFSSIENNHFWKTVDNTRKLLYAYKLSPRKTFELIRILGDK